MSLYNLIPDAFNILADSYAKIGELSSKYADLDGSPKQPKIENQLIELGAYFDTVSDFIILNDAGDAIVGLKTDVNTVNALLLCMKKVAGLGELSTMPLPFQPITTIGHCCGQTFPVGPPGSLLVSDGLKYVVFPMGAAGTTLTSSPTGLVWSSAVGNGLPPGGATGQYLRKNSNSSYDVVWDTLTLSEVSDVTATFTEVNILHGVDTANIGPNQINTLAGINTGFTIQTQINGKLSSALPNGQFWVGNALNVATPVTPTGDVTFNNTGVFAISPLVIVDGDVSNTAGINRTKLANTGFYRIVVNDAVGAMVDNAAITPLRALVSDANGLPTASVTSATALSYVANLTSDAQIQINSKLTVTVTSPAQGDIIRYNGTNWVNFPIGPAGQVLTSTGTDIVWGPATASGLPTGGTPNQYLRKNTNINFDASWHTLILSDITNVSANVNEVNALAGLLYASVNATQFNMLSGLTSNVQNQLNNKLNKSLAHSCLWVGDVTNNAIQFPPGNDGDVLTTVAGEIQWQPGSGGGGGGSFITLTDTPSSYTGQAGKIVKVRADETGLEFDVSGGNSDTRKQYFTADGVATTFTLTDSDPVLIQFVIYGGAVQREGVDYTKNNGTKTVTWIGTAPPVGTVDVFYFTALSFATLETIPTWAAGSFTLAEVLVISVLDGHQQIFRLKDSTRPYVSADLLLEWCLDDWELVSETGYLAIHQVAHGFSVNTVVSRGALAWIAATPSLTNMGWVAEVVDADNFVIRCLNELLVNLSGLTAGQAYYVQADGSVSTTITSKLLYIAVSTTKAIIVGGNAGGTPTIHTFDSTFDSTFA